MATMKQTQNPKRRVAKIKQTVADGWAKLRAEMGDTRIPELGYLKRDWKRG